LCAVTPHYRRDLLLACNWLSHLRSVWISQEVVRISDGALRRVHRGYGGHADLIKQLDLVLEQPNNTS
jgi:predicted Rdx family selenoprotein